MSSELVDMKLERRVVKAAITRLQNSIDASKDKFTLQTDLETIAELFQKYNAVQLTIEKFQIAQVGADEEALEAESDKERGKVEEQKRTIVSKIKSLLDSSNSATNNSNVDMAPSRNSNESSGFALNLKPIPLPIFEGKHSNWCAFYESFKALVGDDATISKIKKFHYLRGCLKDDALRAIESLSMSGDNYENAIDVLKKRFENRRLIVQDHVANILSLKSISKQSPSELRNLIDTVNNNIAALKALKVETTQWGVLLVPILLEKLDFNTRREWQSTLDKEVPSLSSFNNFLEKRFQILEAMNYLKYDNYNLQPSFKNSKPFSRNMQTWSKPVTNQGAKYEKFNTNIASTTLSCFICKEFHTVFQCKDFIDLRVSDRIKKINALNLCINCLRNHDIKNCKSNSLCKECKQKHHSLLHINEFVPAPSTSASTLIISESNRVLFSTVLLLIADSEGMFYQCRAVLDQCSEVCLITENLRKKLKLSIKPSNVSITGVNISDNKVSSSCNVTIKSKVNNFGAEIQCYILPKITRNTPAASFDKNLIKLPFGISLADEQFNISREVDLLLGAALFWKLLLGAPIQLYKNQPYLQNTYFGWIVSGSVDLNGDQSFSCNIISNPTNLETAVARFLDTEQVADMESQTLEEREYETHFRKTTFRDISGKFVIKLPFKNTINLGDSKTLAIKRFYSQEKRFDKDERLAIAYKEFMSEFMQMNHAEEVPIAEMHNKAFYLPHIPVFKQTIHGPKIRIVFDCAALSSNGQSLNNNLQTGENLQKNLFDILCRFRSYKFAVAGDISKMYRMIRINAEDVDYLRFFWRSNTREPIKMYRLTTLTFGLTCAPYLAIRCLKQLAAEAQEAYPEASNVINRDFYMDDLLTGSNSLNKLLEIKSQVSTILSEANFNLCKWSGNHPQLISGADNHSQVELSKTEDVKILGFWWNCYNDELRYKANNAFNCKLMSKRNILATVAKIFDPLGLINPVIVKAKIILQKIWVLKLSWDEQVPKVIETEWIQFLRDIPELNHFRIPRNVIVFDDGARVELHGFSDACTKSLGAAIYVKCVSQTGEASVALICAKSKVAPIKQITLPRLELNAALLLCRLMNKVKRCLEINVVYYWTDSTIVLCWLAETATNWSPYIANRVKEIQENSVPSAWHHVKSEDNPADIVSRGMLPSQLKKSELWWHGPAWLKNDSSEWPPRWQMSNKGLILERKSKAVNIVYCQSDLPILNKISCFFKLTRIIAYCLRFVSNLKSKIKNKAKFLSVTELRRAEYCIIKLIQRNAFSAEFICIQNEKKCKLGKISMLDPFIDHNGILRVGGRLKHAPINFDNKYPILLPEKHHVTNAIIRKIHIEQLHAGKEATLAAVRQQFWPISGRNTVRKIIHSCIKCARINPRPCQQKMGNLPKERLQPLRPFLISGVDYSGYYLIKSSNSRNARKVKAYIALFICFSTKAIHLELVGDLSTDGFIAALKRFTSRRGHVQELFSDNGTNFVGAARQFLKSKEFEKSIVSHCLNVKTKFSFIPARSPHFGGLWERHIQSVKRHLHKVLGNASLNYDEFYTLLTQIEACLNSRPLIPVSNDPNDLEALTPGHFLIGAPLTAPIEEDLTPLNLNRLTRWQRIRQLHQHFWRRWHLQYLTQLQVRPKTQQTEKTDVVIGALVVLMEDNLPPLQWRLGRVIEIHPGSDGVVRVVTVKTNFGLFKRAIKKVCVLPTDAD